VHDSEQSSEVREHCFRASFILNQPSNAPGSEGKNQDIN